MKTAEAAKGRWSEIFEYYGLPPITGKNHFKGECPVCGARGKYRVDDRDGSGSWICVCGSGDGMSLLVKTQGKSFSAISTEVDQIIGNDYRHEKIPVHSSAARLRQRTISKFAKLSPLRGTAGAGYLQHRGITRLPADAIRFCDKQRHAGKVYQALYALATDDKGELCYLHRTLLEGEHKAPLGESAKRQKSMQEENYLEYARSVAIRMFPVSSTLGIAEGIETALSCYQIYA
ncbi:DNA primase, phage associated [Kosakonia radicincitans]|nr:DNA primase, phage associated [Kosakonia radicincitans]